MADLPIPSIIARGEEAESLAAPLGGSPSDAIRRFQIGLAGLAAMLLMIALANIVMDRAKETEAVTVPEAASTAPPKPLAATTSDPLADAGVVPDVPAAKPENVPGQGSGDGPPAP